VKARRTCVFWLTALAALAAPATASAHATLQRSIPANGAVVTTAPSAVRLVFDDTITPASGIRAVRNGGASVLGGRAHVVGGKTLVVPLRRIGDGDYTVLWRAVSDDGHTIAGVIAFGVGAGRAPPTPSLRAEEGRSVRAVVSRWLFFAGLLVAGGSAVFRIAVGRAHLSVLFGGLLTMVVGGAGLLGHHADFSTRFGAAYGVATVLAAFCATLAAVAAADARVAPIAWMLPLPLLAVPSVAGHALDRGRPFIEFPVDALHVVAASVWVGGLVELALVLSAGGRERARVARRFSRLAGWSVLVIAVTGVVRAITELGAVDRIWSTGYGRWLIVKTALLAALVAIGWINRSRLLPRLEFAPLRRAAGAELLLIAAVVVAVAFLTDSRPGRDQNALAAPPPAASSLLALPPPPPRDAVVLAREDGSYAVALAVDSSGSTVSVLAPSGVGKAGLRVQIVGRSARSCGSGCYAADVVPRGRVPVTIDGRTVEFTLPPHTPPAGALAARATRAFRALRSVRYVERLASSPTNKLVSTFTLERPDRIEYRIRHGSAGVVIGSRRWDLTQGTWVPSETSPLRQPEPIWGGSITNAHLLARTPESLVVSFLNPTVPAWFTVRLDRRTLLPRDLHMTAAAHFMTHRYLAFNEPRRIFPPKR
jgi:copper transport protein